MVFSTRQLEIMNMQLRHRYAPPTYENTPHDDAASILAQDARRPSSFLGRQPGTETELRGCLSLARDALGRFSARSADTVREDDYLLDALFRGFGNQKRHAQLQEVYTRVLAALSATGVDVNKLKIVSMVCCGGSPFRHYGMGDSVEESVQRQLELANRYGLIFDLIPCLFCEFDTSLLDMSVAIGAVLLQKLKNNELGRGRVDGILFCCKGTMSAALAARAFSKWTQGAPYRQENTRAARHVALMGMGTDLSQGFAGWCTEDMQRVGLAMSTVNSLQDTNVGEGRNLLSTFISKAGSGNSEVWLDIEPLLQQFGGRQPEHSWYYEAFWRKSAVPVRHAILSHLSRFSNAEPAGSTNELIAPPIESPLAPAVRALLASRVNASGTPVLLNLNELANFKSGRALKPVTPHVKQIGDWVRGAMFIRE